MVLFLHICCTLDMFYIIRVHNKSKNMDNFLKFSERIDILKLIIDIISVVVIEGCDVFLVFRANEIANY